MFNHHQSSTSTTIPKATWPESLPHPEETEFLSLVLHSDCIRWCLHVRLDSEFRAKYWWKTEGSALAENTEETPFLQDVVPAMVLRELTGNNTGPHAISEWSYVKRVPTWTVYVLTADPTQDAAPVLHHLFRGVPCRFFALQSFDFFPRFQQQQQEQQRIHQLPLYLVSSLKFLMNKAQEDGDESVLLLDIKQSSLEYVAFRGTKIIGQGVGPSLHNFNKNPEHRFHISEEPPQNVSAYLEIMGIVKIWDDRSKGCKQRKIWMEGYKADTDMMQSLLGKSATTTIKAVPNLVHYGIDTVVKEQTDIHGEMNEPLDRLLVGQRVKFADSPLFGTVRNAIPRDNNTNVREFQYNVELDEGKRQQVLNMNQLMASIVLFVKHKEPKLSSLDPKNDYTIMLVNKIETAKSAIALVEKESKRLDVSHTSVATHSTPPRRDLQNRVLGDDDSHIEFIDKRQAAEEADPEAPRKRSYVGRGVAKHFGKKLYFGIISDWDPAAIVDEKVDLWKVDYEDGDAEDMEEEEMHICLDRYVQAKGR